MAHTLLTSHSLILFVQFLLEALQYLTMTVKDSGVMV